MHYETKIWQPSSAVLCCVRAIQTAEPILARHESLCLQKSELLNEVCTPFDGQPIKEMEKRSWDVYTGNELPYEQPSDVLARGKRFLAEVHRDFSGKQVVAVTHGDVIAFLMLWAKGMPITPQDKQTLYKDFLAPASITTFVFESMLEGEVPRIEYVVPH